MAVTAYKRPGTVTEDTGNPSDNSGVGVLNYTNWTGTTTATIDWTTDDHRSFRYKLTNFAFTTADVPAGSTVNGFEFSYNRRENSTSDNIGLRSLFMIKADGTVITGTNKSDAPAEWPTTAATQTLPATNPQSDLWGYTGVTASDVLDTDFGIAVEFWTTNGTSNVSGTTPDADTIKDLQLRIYYTEDSPENVALTLSQTSASSLTANLYRQRVMTLSLSSVSTGTMNLYRQRLLALSRSGDSSLTATLRKNSALTLSKSADSSLVATLARNAGMTLAQTAVSSLTAVLNVAYQLALSLTGESSLTATLNAGRALTLSKTADSAFTGNLSVNKAMTLSKSSVSTGTLNLVRVIPLTISQSAVSSMVAALARDAGGAFTHEAACSLAATLGVNRGLTLSATSESSLNASLTVVSANRRPAFLGDSNLMDY